MLHVLLPATPHRCCNYAVQAECVTCEASCQNRRIQQSKGADISVLETPLKGYGLFANAALEVDTYVREYVGEIVDLPELLRRRARMGPAQHMYAMEIKADTYIDSTAVGSISRFINHSCAPNCTAEVWVVKGRLRVAITTTKEIKQGEELTFDYAWEVVEGQAVTVCRCGTAACRGTIEIVTPEDSEYLEATASCAARKTGLWRPSNDAFLEAKAAEEADNKADSKSENKSENMDIEQSLTSSDRVAHSASPVAGQSPVAGNEVSASSPSRSASPLAEHMIRDIKAAWLVGQRVKVRGLTVYLGAIYDMYFIPL
jgi:hypothetical protein